MSPLQTLREPSHFSKSFPPGADASVGNVTIGSMRITRMTAFKAEVLSQPLACLLHSPKDTAVLAGVPGKPMPQERSSKNPTQTSPPFGNLQRQL